MITPNSDTGHLSDRELAERTAMQLDHVDSMLHEQARLLAQIEPLLPLIPRALALLDPGQAMRKHFAKGNRRAVPQRKTAPLHVGEASPDSAEVGT
jgi:hypothetical protein